MQLNDGSLFSRFGRYMRIAYILLGIVIVVWTFNKSISFLEGFGICFYIIGSIVLIRFSFFYKNNRYCPSLQEMFPLTKSDKTKIIKDILKIVACFAAVFVVMVVGTLADPKTQAGFIMFFEAPIVIIILIIVALIARISFRLLLKPHLRF